MSLVVAAYASGLALLVLFVGIALYLTVRPADREVPEIAMWMFRVVLSLAGGAFVGVLSGFLQVESKVAGFSIQAAGGLAVFLLIYRTNPPSLMTHHRKQQTDVGAQHSNTVGETSAMVTPVRIHVPPLLVSQAPTAPLVSEESLEDHVEGIIIIARSISEHDILARLGVGQSDQAEKNRVAGCIARLYRTGRIVRNSLAPDHFQPRKQG